MITKGSGNNKHEEQDGWIGAIVANDLIVKRLYQAELLEIENNKLHITELDTELAEFVEGAKVEDNDEFIELFDTLKKNGHGEP